MKKRILIKKIHKLYKKNERLKAQLNKLYEELNQRGESNVQLEIHVQNLKNQIHAHWKECPLNKRDIEIVLEGDSDEFEHDSDHS